jgi:hypothetical protein
MKTKFNLFLTLSIALIAQIAFAQERSVSGTVTDANGMPLPGVSVTVKGTTNGSQTDLDGKFQLQASSTETLVFSFVGMKTQEVIASNTTIHVKLAE